MLRHVNESASSEDRAAEAVGQGSVVQILCMSRLDLRIGLFMRMPLMGQLP